MSGLTLTLSNKNHNHRHSLAKYGIGNWQLGPTHWVFSVLLLLLIGKLLLAILFYPLGTIPKNIIQHTFAGRDNSTDVDVVTGIGAGTSPFPHRGYKYQINSSALTVNDYECLNLDTGNWPSERVHCELLPSSHRTHEAAAAATARYRYEFVVEHFDDPNCQNPNPSYPVVRHTSSGCVYYPQYNHSYHDLCHDNRTFTISAFVGDGCIVPLNVTAVNLPNDDSSDDGIDGVDGVDIMGRSGDHIGGDGWTEMGRRLRAQSA